MLTSRAAAQQEDLFPDSGSANPEWERQDRERSAKVARAEPLRHEKAPAALDGRPVRQICGSANGGAWPFSRPCAPASSFWRPFFGLALAFLAFALAFFAALRAGLAFALALDGGGDGGIIPVPGRSVTMTSSISSTVPSGSVSSSSNSENSFSSPSSCNQAIVPPRNIGNLHPANRHCCLGGL